jgi:hypothetical protein
MSLDVQGLLHCCFVEAKMSLDRLLCQLAKERRDLRGLLWQDGGDDDGLCVLMNWVAHPCLN